MLTPSGLDKPHNKKHRKKVLLNTGFHFNDYVGKLPSPQTTLINKYLPPQWLHFKDIYSLKTENGYTKVQRNRAIFYHYIASNSLSIIVIRLFDTHKMIMEM